MRYIYFVGIMQQQQLLDKTLARLFALERNKLMETYENRFSSFELKLQILLENKEPCRCTKQENFVLQVLNGLETEFSKLRQECLCSNELQQELLKQLKMLNKCRGSVLHNGNDNTNLELSYCTQNQISINTMKDEEAAKTSQENVTMVTDTSINLQNNPFDDNGSSDKCQYVLNEPISAETNQIVCLKEEIGVEGSWMDYAVSKRSVTSETHPVLEGEDENLHGELLPNKTIGLQSIQPEESVAKVVELRKSMKPSIPGTHRESQELSFKGVRCASVQLQHPNTSFKKIYKCDLCCFVTMYKLHFEKHKRSHFKERLNEFTCKVCGCTFTSTSILKKHMATHTGGRKYSCQYCYKTFTQHSSKSRHERSHTGIKPYVCKYCSKAFSDSSYFNRHVIKHHTKLYPHRCHRCEKGFFTPGVLKKHLIHCKS